MKNLKIGILLIVVGNLLYLVSIYFGKNETSNFGNFIDGLLIGLSVACNLVGIVISIRYVSKNNKE